MSDILSAVADELLRIRANVIAKFTLDLLLDCSSLLSSSTASELLNLRILDLLGPSVVDFVLLLEGSLVAWFKKFFPLLVVPAWKHELHL